MRGHPRGALGSGQMWRCLQCRFPPGAHSRQRVHHNWSVSNIFLYCSSLHHQYWRTIQTPLSGLTWTLVSLAHGSSLTFHFGAHAILHSCWKRCCWIWVQWLENRVCRLRGPCPIPQPAVVSYRPSSLRFAGRWLRLSLRWFTLRTFTPGENLLIVSTFVWSLVFLYFGYCQGQALGRAFI